jgi:hypothetical protein
MSGSNGVHSNRPTPAFGQQRCRQCSAFLWRPMGRGFVFRVLSIYSRFEVDKFLIKKRPLLVLLETALI